MFVRPISRFGIPGLNGNAWSGRAGPRTGRANAACLSARAIALVGLVAGLVEGLAADLDTRLAVVTSVQGSSTIPS
jgi:hypothetical protein